MAETAQQSSLAEVFQRDPEKLTKTDLEQVVIAFRAARATFNAGGKGAKAAGSRVKTGTKKLLNIDELFT